MNIKKVVLVIVDISGYTQFIRSQKLSAIHVEEIVFELLGAVIDHAAYPLTLNKLEGDAAFLYAEINADNQTEVARNVARQVYEFFKVFYERTRTLSTERIAIIWERSRFTSSIREKNDHAEPYSSIFSQFS